MMSLANGFMVQLRVIHAVILRETKTRFGQHKAGYLWALLEPLFWIGTFAGMYTLLGRDEVGGMPLIPFLATGILPYQLFAMTTGSVANAINGNKALLFYPQVQPIDLVLSRAALEAATYAIVFFLIVGGYALVVQHLEIDSLLVTLWGMLLASLLGMTFGLISCALNVVSQTVERIRGPLMKPLFWMSGLFFTAESLPSDVREVMLWNPVLHCTELVRAGWFEQYHGRYASSTFVLAWVVAFAFVGLTLERAVRRKVQLT